jgi:carboxypeptidase T
MKNLVCILISFFLSSYLFAQSGPYSRVLFRPTPLEWQIILSKGVALDHLHSGPDGYIGEFSSEETQILFGNCASVSVLVKDIQSYFVQQGLQPENNKRGQSYTTPKGFSYGSMGNFLTLAEADSHFNVMLEKYPALISKRDTIGYSIEGRPIYSFKLSDNPNVDEDEAEVLYTALHHAREPLSMMQLVYFLYYALENYGKDAHITHIINNSEMFFVPIVNPDGYYYNQVTNPSGGGMWRKNRRLNADGSYGVDLNRNYGLTWAKNNVGSSPDGSSETYRGTMAFSEPETQAIRDLCKKRQFKLALNYHAFGNHLIYPWGDDAGNSTTADFATYQLFAKTLNVENQYKIGTFMQTLQYLGNGISDDWMYGEQSEKNKIFAFTPEVSEVFWPSDLIKYESDRTIRMNINLASLAIQLKKITDIPGTQITDIDIYPNPSSGKLFISNPSNMSFQMSIMDYTGRILFSGMPEEEGIDISNFGNGLYYCTILRIDKLVVKKKLVILK